MGVQYRKIAAIKKKDGTFVDKQTGKEKNRYQEVGALLSTPHGSNMFIRMNATAYSDSQTLGIFPVEGVKLSAEISEEKEPDVDF